MSMTLMAQAMSIKVGNPIRKLVLIKLADNANDKGECWPSYQHIADQCEIGRSTVKSHIKALESMGLVRREYRKNGAQNQSNLFHLNFNKLFTDASKAKTVRNKAAEMVELKPGKGVGQDLTGVGHEMTGVGQEMAQGRSAHAPRSGSGAAPRTSHSFESVNEPVIEPIYITPPVKVAVMAPRGKTNYSPEFEKAWQAYPKRAGCNPKISAWKAWSARLREGVKPEDILSGVRRYADYVHATGSAGTQFVKQAATFFGPDRHFEDDWTKPRSEHITFSTEQCRFFTISEPDKTIPEGFIGYLP